MNVNDAAHFLEYHYPVVEFRLAHSRGVDSEPVTVGINYSRGREDEGGRDEQDWKCPEVSPLTRHTLPDQDGRLSDCFDSART